MPLDSQLGPKQAPSSSRGRLSPSLPLGWTRFPIWGSSRNSSVVDRGPRQQENPSPSRRDKAGGGDSSVGASDYPPQAKWGRRPAIRLPEEL